MTTEMVVLVVGWLLLTGAGLALTTYMMYVSWGDLKNVKKLNLNGELQALSKLAIWQEARRFVIKLVLFTIGIASFFETSAHPERQQKNDVFGWFFVVVLYGTVMLLNYSSIAAIRFRRRYINKKISNEKRSRS